MLEAWFFIAAALLVVSGGSKIYDPASTAGALRSAGLPGGNVAAYGVGVVEIVAALSGTLLGGWASLSVAIIYTGFAGFVGYALVRQLPLQSCGCFGKSDTPPSRGHLIFNLVSAGAAVGVAVSGTPPIDLLGDQPLSGVPYLGFVALGVWTVYLLLAELPRIGRAGP